MGNKFVALLALLFGTALAASAYAIARMAIAVQTDVAKNDIATPTFAPKVRESQGDRWKNAFPEPEMPEFALEVDLQIPQSEATNNLEVFTASYLGGDGDDRAAGVDIAPDRTIVFAGTFTGEIAEISNNNLLGDGNGTVIRTDATGREILSVSRIGSEIFDLDVDGDRGNIAIVGDFGIALLSPEADRLLWHDPLAAIDTTLKSYSTRVSIGEDGNIAILADKKIVLFDRQGNAIAYFPVVGGFAADIVVHSPSRSLIVTGFTQKDGGGCSQLQVAFLRAYGYDSRRRWENYDWTHAEAFSHNSSCADTRGYRIALGEDGLMYFAGESAGGNSIFRYQPRNLNAEANNIHFDPYTRAYNTSSNHITYVARFDPYNGDLERGQFHLGRLPDGRGNAMQPRAIAADEAGNVYIGGRAFYHDRMRDTAISGQFGSYAVTDNFVLAIAPDFSSRHYLVSWNRGCEGENIVVGIAAARGVRAMTSNTAGCDMITVNARQARPQGGAEMLYSVWEP